jgi:hypothetical protein
MDVIKKMRLKHLLENAKILDKNEFLYKNCKISNTT